MTKDQTTAKFNQEKVQNVSSPHSHQNGSHGEYSGFGSIIESVDSISSSSETPSENSKNESGHQNDENVFFKLKQPVKIGDEQSRSIDKNQKEEETDPNLKRVATIVEKQKEYKEKDLNDSFVSFEDMKSEESSVKESKTPD